MSEVTQGENGAAENTPAPVASTASPSGESGTSVGTAVAGAGAAAAATRAEQEYRYKEDRSNWVPPHRLREINERARQYEQQLYLERQRVAALSGVQPPAAPEDPEAAAIRTQFEKLYPGLAKLNKMADKLEKFGEIDPQELTSSQEHYFTVLGQQTLSRLDQRVAEVIGAEPTGFARQALHVAFGAFVRHDPENANRYAAQDPKLLDDFLKEYQNGILDPYRRRITTATAPRNEAVKRLPRGGNSSAIAAGGPAKPAPTDSDEFHRAAFSAFSQNR